MTSLRRAAAAAPVLLLAAALAAAAATPPAKPAAPATKPAAAAPKPAARRAARPTDKGERLDAIAAMVNDEPVLASDVEEQLFLFLQNSGARPDSLQADTLRRQILDQLIDEKLILAEAKRQDISVPESEVNRQVDQSLADAKQRLGGEEQYQAQLKRENLTEAQVRAKYRTELERTLPAQRLVDKLFPHREVPAADAEKYFLANRAKFPKKPGDIRLSVIQIAPQPDSAALAAGRAKIEGLRKRIVGGEKFAKVAQEASDDPGSAKSGGDLGYFSRGQMEKAVENAAFSLKPGQMSEPVRSAYGWHLVQLVDRDTVKTAAGRDSTDDKGQPVVEVHARHILVRVPPTDDDVDRALQLARSVQQQAAKGVAFASLVHRYSTYDGPADADGDVGFVSIANLQANIRAGLDSLEVGQVSEVLPNQAGFNIFKVTDRHPERDYTLDEIRAELPNAVEQVQRREKYEAWVKGLRAKAQIEYRDL